MEPYGRIRIRREQATLLFSILHHERGRLIELKIDERAAGEDPTALREELAVIKYLMEEVKRAIQDIDAQSSGD
jgi:hypothetical protein